MSNLPAKTNGGAAALVRRTSLRQRRANIPMTSSVPSDEGAPASSMQDTTVTTSISDATVIPVAQGVVSRTSSLRRRSNSPMKKTEGSDSVTGTSTQKCTTVNTPVPDDVVTGKSATNSSTVMTSISQDAVIPLRDNSQETIEEKAEETAEQKAVRKARAALAEAEQKAAKKIEAAKKKASKKEAKAVKKASKKGAKAAKKASKKGAKAAKKASKKKKKAAKKLDKRMSGIQARLVRTSSLGHVDAARAVSAALEAARAAEEEKIKLVIPFGCEEGQVESRVECLLHYILRDLDMFDEVIFYENTKNANDIAYLRALASMLNDKFTLLTPDEILGGEEGISALFTHLREPNTLYILAEDDIVFVAEGAFAELSVFARQNRGDYTIFSGNVVNNGPLDEVHQRSGVSIRETRISYEDPYDDLYKPNCARQVHASAMRAIKQRDGKSVLDYRSIGNYLYLDQEEFGLNVIAFFGDSFTDADLVGITDKGAEKYICRKMGDDDERVAVVVGNTFFVHYSFPRQHRKKKNFDPEEQILNDYRYLAGLEGEGALSILERLRS